MLLQYLLQDDELSVTELVEDRLEHVHRVLVAKRDQASYHGSNDALVGAVQLDDSAERLDDSCELNISVIFMH